MHVFRTQRNWNGIPIVGGVWRCIALLFCVERVDNVLLYLSVCMGCIHLRQLNTVYWAILHVQRTVCCSLSVHRQLQPTGEYANCNWNATFPQTEFAHVCFANYCFCKFFNIYRTRLRCRFGVCFTIVRFEFYEYIKYWVFKFSSDKTKVTL